MNHAFVIVKGSLPKEDKIRQYLAEINDKRFNGIFSITEHSKGNWQVSYKKDYKYSFFIWVATKRKLEMRKLHGDFSSWMQAVFQNDLALKLNGKCADEGISEKWNPETNIFPLYIDWFKAIYHDSCSNVASKQFVSTLFSESKNSFPKDLQQFYGEL